MSLDAFAAVGIEIEYMIVDAHTLAVRPIAAPLLAALAADASGEAVEGFGWSNELVAHVVEVKNERPCASFHALAAGFNTEVARANRLLAALDARLMPTGMHPWMNARRETHLWADDPRGIYAAYDRIFDCRAPGWSNVQAMHLNLPFADDRQFARLHAASRLVLPLVPALAASSPFADGMHADDLDARLAACAANARACPAIAGRMVPEPVASRAAYESVILAPMYRQMALLDPTGTLRHEWLNSRAAIARFDRDALELRAFDVQECPTVDVAIAVAVTATVRRLYESDTLGLRAQHDTGALAAILARCTALGERAVIDDAGYLAAVGFPGERCEARALWAHWIAAAPECGLDPWREPLRTLVEEGPLARRLLRAVGPRPRRERLAAVYATLCDCLAECRVFRDVRP